jgi:hypothetical protein
MSSARTALLFGIVATVVAVQVQSPRSAWLKDATEPVTESSLPAFWPNSGFIENVGQHPNSVAYARQLVGSDLFVLRDARLVHAFPAEQPTAGSKRASWVVVESLDGAVSPTTEGVSRLDSHLSWLMRDGAGVSRTPGAYEAIRIRQPWPGIDLTLRVSSEHTERVFSVAPGADPSTIRLKFDGAQNSRLLESGALLLSSGGQSVTLSAPIAYQEIASGKRPVRVRYRAAGSPVIVTFEVGPYDRKQPLTIDPILQSTYFGDVSPNSAIVTKLAADPLSGDLFVSGIAQSNNLPALEGGFQTLDVVRSTFVARIDPKLQRAVQTTLFGGFSDESIYGLAIHPVTGDVYIAGDTLSPDLLTTGGSPEPHMIFGHVDGFIARLSADLRTGIQATYYGGKRGPLALRGLAISPTNGDVYVVSNTDAPNNSVHVTRFNPELTQRITDRMIVTTGPIRGTSVAINGATGDVYVGGLTRDAQFPKVAGGASQTLAPSDFNETAFVARFDAALSQHVQSTFVFQVASGLDLFNYLAIDPVSGDVYSAGETGAAPAFPVVNALQPTFGGGSSDVFVARLSADLKQTIASTFYGGSSDEVLLEIAPDPTGTALYLMGTVFSSDLPGTAGGAVESGPGNRPKGFIARVAAQLTTIEQATYFTGASDVRGGALALHPHTAEVYLGGFTGGTIPETTGALQEQPGAAFIARLDPLLRAEVDTDPDSFAFVDHAGVAPGTIVTSAPARIGGITVPAPISVVGGEYSVGQNPFTTTAGTIERGQTVRVRHTSSMSAGGVTLTALTIGSVGATFSSTTESGADTTPNAFSFATIDPVARDITVTSNAVIVAGMDAPTTISVSDGEYSLDGEPFTALSGNVHAGQQVVVRHRTSTDLATPTDTGLTIGSTSAVFRTVTDPIDATPHAFDLEEPTGPVDANSDFISQGGVDSINVPVPISIVGGEYSIRGGPFTNAGGLIENLNNFQVRVHTGPPGSTVSTTVTIGGVSDELSVTSRIDDLTPDPFDFTDRASVSPGTEVISNTAAITGINVPLTSNVTNCELSINSSQFSGAPGLAVRNGDQLRLRAVSSATPGQTVTCTISLGTATDTFSVTTASSNGGGGGGGGGAPSVLLLLALAAVAVVRLRSRGTI